MKHYVVSIKGFSDPRVKSFKNAWPPMRTEWVRKILAGPFDKKSDAYESAVNLIGSEDDQEMLVDRPARAAYYEMLRKFAA